MAGIIKRNGRKQWYAVYRDVDGKERRKSTGIEIAPIPLPGQSSKSAKQNAETRARLIAQEIEAHAKGKATHPEIIEALGSDADRIHGGIHSGMSVKKYLEEFIKIRKDKKGAEGRDGKAVKQFLAFLSERSDIPLSRINKSMARDFMEVELERVSSSTVKRYMESLTCAFNRAVEQNLISSCPFKGVIPPKDKSNDKQERRAFSANDIKRLLEVLPPEWKDMVLTCLYTGGQRLGDIARMKWEQIDFEGQTIAMTTEKTKRRMIKPMIQQLETILRKRDAEKINGNVFPIAASKFTQAGNKTSKISLEFTDLLKKHNFISPEDNSQRIGDRRNLSELSFHSLRSTAVTILRNAGVPADLCRYIVGHDSEDIERQYVRPQSEDVIKAIQKIHSELDNKASTNRT